MSLQNHVKPGSLLVKADGTTEVQEIAQNNSLSGSGSATRGRRLSYVTNDVSSAECVPGFCRTITLQQTAVNLSHSLLISREGWCTAF